MLAPAGPADAADIEALLDASFGAARHLRTASLLRTGAEPIAGPSLVARDGARLMGSIQFWPVELAMAGASSGEGEGITPLILLGPVAVAADARLLGLGRRLLAASLAIVDADDLGPIVLIGDASYYGPFGFDAARTGKWTLPGPVERHRLLLRQDKGNATDLPVAATLRTRCRAVAAL